MNIILNEEELCLLVGLLDYANPTHEATCYDLTRGGVKEETGYLMHDLPDELSLELFTRLRHELWTQSYD